mmetsp:Transcript_39580/g.70971  ORF Transcript_39580/g.70971 Transcript_39580/m.70971 type:complete len:202 (+) Transcript_39580:641-1246(+)
MNPDNHRADLALALAVQHAHRDNVYVFGSAKPTTANERRHVSAVSCAVGSQGHIALGAGLTAVNSPHNATPRAPIRISKLFVCGSHTRVKHIHRDTFPSPIIVIHPIQRGVVLVDAVERPFFAGQALPLSFRRRQHGDFDSTVLPLRGVSLHRCVFFSIQNKLWMGGQQPENSTLVLHLAECQSSVPWDKGDAIYTGEGLQ